MQIIHTKNLGEPSITIIQLAQRLVTLEEADDSGLNPNENAAIRVITKLRILLTRFAGSDGFLALMRRALVLTRQKDPSLADYKLSEHGSFEFEGISVESSLKLTTELLDLMATFIGKAHLLSLLKQVWPLNEKKAG